MNRFLPFLLILLVADLAVGEEANDPNAPVANVMLDKTNGIEIQQTPPIIIKRLWKGRSASARGNSLDSASGIGDRTEIAVLRGLRWLVSCQNKDGAWGEKAEELEASTGLALLAFIGHGETPASTEYGKSVEAGLKYLLSIQKATNLTNWPGNQLAISHAVSTWAICDGYSLTLIPFLQSNGDEGLRIVIKGQRPSGLWDEFYRMDDGQDDMEASIWQVLALQSGKRAGSQLDGLQNCLDKAAAGMEKALDTNLDTGTKAGLVFGMQLCGQTSKPVVQNAITNLFALTSDWNAPSFNDPIFRWYLITEAIFQNGGKPWGVWNRQFAPMLVNHQVKQERSGGVTLGYWDSPGKQERFGRVYSTALSLLMLEIYYQFNSLNRLPAYDRIPDSTNDVVIKIQ